VLEQAARALDARDVAAVIGTRRLLLVLDNFEQVMDAAGDVAALLAPCPGLSILVTSREPLHVQAEHQYRLHPLAIDEAVELFLARARARAASVAVDDDLVAVCEQLDRLPLAIELAAARAGVLTVRQLRERLSERLPLLTGGARDAPERQRTLRAAIAWSHDLLARPERQVFDRLAVFRGGCTLEAAEAVCDADVDALLALVDKSLVRHAGGRFRLLETVHEFAVDQLAEAPDVHEIIRRHGDWYLRLAEPASQKTMHDPVLIETLDADRANLELALERALGRRDRPFALRLVGHLAYLWIARGFSEEAGRLIDRTIALAGEEAGPEALGALIAGANAALMRSDWDALRALGGRLVAIGRAHGSPHALVRGLLSQAWAANNEGDFDAAVALLEEAREPAVVAGVTAAVEFELGDSLLQRGSYAEAERFFESVLRPDYPDRSSGLVVAALLNIGAARLALGRREEAAGTSLEALQTSVDSGLHITAGPALALLAAALAQQEPLAAARLLGAGEGLGGLYDSPVERSLREAAVDELTAALGRETFARLRAEGSRLSLEEALSEATAQAASRTTS